MADETTEKLSRQAAIEQLQQKRELPIWERFEFNRAKTEQDYMLHVVPNSFTVPE